MKMSPKKLKKVVAVFRGLPKRIGARLPGGVAAAMRLAVAADPHNTQLFSFASATEEDERNGMINQIIRQDLNTTEVVASVDPKLVEGGYLAANSDFWPHAHDLDGYVREILGVESAVDQEARHSKWGDDHSRYLIMNRLFTEAILAQVPEHDELHFVYHDYQIARGARQVRKRRPHARIAHFVHTPWGTDLESPNMAFLDEIARGITAADVIGFHTVEWRDNFIRHLTTRFPGRYYVDYSGADPVIRRHNNNRVTKLVVQPIGVHFQLWRDFSNEPITLQLPQDTFNWLSVERADITKAILERMIMIPRYFELYPEHRGKVRWVQIAEKTRDHIPIFHKYWEVLEQQQAKLIELGFGDAFIWYKKGLPPHELAPTYRQAHGIAVTSHKDGYAMVYPEALSSGDPDNPPVGILTKGTGCSATLGDGAILVADPRNIDAMCHAFAQGYALRNSLTERVRRHRWTIEQIQANDLHYWATRMFDELAHLRVA